MILQDIEDFKAPLGYINKKDLLGAAEAWVSKLKEDIDTDSRVNDENRRALEVGVELMSLFFGFKKLGDNSDESD